jgi:hypothetical protein
MKGHNVIMYHGFITNMAFGSGYIDIDWQLFNVVVKNGKKKK